jgi:serine/threonine protein phosphatase PrpC
MGMPRPPLQAAARSETGPNRSNNEDAVLARLDPPLFAVADGLGGHHAGEVASRIAIETLTASRPDPARPERWLRQALNSANLAIWNHGHGNVGEFDLQTTATALLVAGADAVIGHVGDCRAYLVRDGVAEQWTSDHTRAMEMLRLRIITPEQAVHHPARSQLTRSLGAELFVSVDVVRRQLRKGDCIVLCSDGLWSELSREEIAETVGASADPAVAAESMIRVALSRDAADNVSVVVVRVVEPLVATSTVRGRRWLPWP